MILSGEVALVTGGARGIGAASCLALAKEGAHVFVNYCHSEDKAKSLCQQIESNGGKATPVKFDVSDTEQTKKAIEEISKNQSISILVNNSGITRDGLVMRYSVEDWDKVLQTNLRGAFITSQAVVRGMMKARKGSIINMSSIVGITGNPGQAAYCASKAGLIGMTKSFAQELASRNIRVNAIAPGFIETEMTNALTPQQKEEILKNIPLARIGKAEEIAHAVVFLASSRSNYITGQTIIVDGGMG